MKRKESPRTQPARSAAGAQLPQVSLLLREIEKEPVPERLLELAFQLQEALVRKRSEGEQASPRVKRAARSQ